MPVLPALGALNTKQQTKCLSSVGETNKICLAMQMPIACRLAHQHLLNNLCSRYVLCSRHKPTMKRNTTGARGTSSQRGTSLPHTPSMPRLMQAKAVWLPTALQNSAAPLLQWQAPWMPLQAAACSCTLWPWATSVTSHQHVSGAESRMHDYDAGHKAHVGPSATLCSGTVMKWQQTVCLETSRRTRYRAASAGKHQGAATCNKRLCRCDAAATCTACNAWYKCRSSLLWHAV